MGYVILLWHSQSLPYNYLAVSKCLLSSSNIVLVYEPHHEKAFHQGFCPGPTKNLPAKPQKIARDLLETAVFLLNILLFRDFTFIFLFESKLPAEDIDNIL